MQNSSNNLLVKSWDQNEKLAGLGQKAADESFTYADMQAQQEVNLVDQVVNSVHQSLVAGTTQPIAISAIAGNTATMNPKPQVVKQNEAVQNAFKSAIESVEQKVKPTERRDSVASTMTMGGNTTDTDVGGATDTDAGAATDQEGGTVSKMQSKEVGGALSSSSSSSSSSSAALALADGALAPIPSPSQAVANAMSNFGLTERLGAGAKPRYPPKTFTELEAALYKYQNSYASDCFFIQNYNCKMLLPFKNAFPDMDPAVKDADAHMKSVGYNAAGDFSGTAYHTNPYHMDSPADFDSNAMLASEAAREQKLREQRAALTMGGSTNGNGALANAYSKDTAAKNRTNTEADNLEKLQSFQFIDEYVYMLVLNPDSQSNGHCQWFNFAMKNHFCLGSPF